MPYKICLGCSALIASGSRCSDCKSAHERSRGTSTERGYGYEWQKIRAQVLSEEPVCAVCGTDKDLTVDHVISRHDDGTDERSNLRTLCFFHNRQKGKKSA